MAGWLQKRHLQEFKIVPFIIGIIHCIATLFGDPIIFYKVNYVNFKMYWLIKPIALFSLLIFWQILFYTFREIKKGNNKIIKISKFTGIYLGITLFLLLLTWPGVWRWDEFYILHHASKVEFMYWYHFITSVIYIFSLCIFPFPGGIILIQIFFISLMIGIIMYKLSEFINGKWIYLFYIPYILPAVLTNNMYPMRIVLYSYIETTLFCLIFFKILKKENPGYKDMVLWGILAGMTCSWRSEGIAYIFLIPILMIIFFYKKIDIKKFASMFLSLIIVTFSIILIQMRKNKENDYFITGIAEPLHGIVSQNFKSETPEEDLQIIDKVLSVRLLKYESGDSAYWNGKRNYTQEDFEKFKAVYYKLLINNIPLFLKNRIKMFIQTSGMVMDMSTTLGDTPNMYNYFDKDTSRGLWAAIRTFIETYRFNRPLSIRLRSEILTFLECRYHNNYEKTTYAFPVFYNILPVILPLIGICIYGIVKKNRLLFFIPLLPLIKTGLIFITAPISVFMYYLPIYIFGLSFITILLLLRYKGSKNII